MKISAVIPYFNRSRFIGECLDSVFAQSRPPDEVIVVDDASRPEERRALDQYLPKIKIVDMPQNGGAAAARNAGLAAVTHEYVAFQDSDDIWEPNKLERQIQYLESHPGCDGVHTAIRSIHNHGEERVSDPLPPQLTLKDALTHNMIRVQSLLVRTEVMRKLDGFDPKLRISEDDDLSIRLAASGSRIDYLETPLVRMRRQGHDHLCQDWNKGLPYKLSVVWKHRSLFDRELGRGAVRRRMAYDIRKAGSLRGKIVGRLMFAAGWVLGGFDATAD